jgi:hypothetical protein
MRPHVAFAVRHKGSWALTLDDDLFSPLWMPGMKRHA